MKSISMLRVAFATSLLFTVSTVSAADQVFGDWIVVSSGHNGDSVAATFSDGTKTAFAVRCYAKSGKCMHLVRLGSGCETGSSYPILINAPSGAVAVTGICNASDGEPEMFLTPFDNVRAMLKGSGVFGVAVPMASGAFKAVRFSLNGSEQALKAGEELATRSPSSTVTDTGRRGSVTF